jgi:hypothetical protein
MEGKIWFFTGSLGKIDVLNFKQNNVTHITIVFNKEK